MFVFYFINKHCLFLMRVLIFRAVTAKKFTNGFVTVETWPQSPDHDVLLSNNNIIYDT